MSMNNTLAAVLSKMVNAEKLSKREFTTLQNSKVIRTVLDIMKGEGFIAGYTEVEDRKGNFLKVQLSGSLNKAGVITPQFTVARDGFEQIRKKIPSSEGLWCYHLDNE